MWGTACVLSSPEQEVIQTFQEDMDIDEMFLNYCIRYREQHAFWGVPHLGGAKQQGD